MAQNTRRYTAGLLLTTWALSFSGLVLFVWRVHLHRHLFDSSHYPTALGDQAYYTQALSPDGSDYYDPSLKLPNQPQGLYRQSVNPIPKADRLMHSLGPDSTGRYTVYVEARRPDSGRCFLKAAEDRYIAFGERKHWPAYQPPPITKAVPLSAEELARLGLPIPASSQDPRSKQ
jgi:hypothetical protein